MPACAISGVLEAGCDEAGRGCLAGPVFAAAVILPDDFTHPWLNDSKQLSEVRRMELRPIIQWQALAWAIGTASPEEIDEINILNASILAMHRALDIPHTTYIKGDGRFANIAAASILAKTSRDEYMLAAAAEYPGYDWESNKGYPTEAHREAIHKLGLTPLHRKTFKC